MHETSAHASPDAPAPASVPTRGPVAGRTCGTCTLCCKAVAVEEVAKPIGAWCPHCIRQKGCAIYDARPASCRTFYCQWMLVSALGPEWKPDRAKFVLAMTEADHLTAFVDPGLPSAWRRPPYYENLKRWAVHGAHAYDGPHIVDVRIGARCIVILPDRDEDIGTIEPDEKIRLERKMSETGQVFLVQKVKQ